MNPQPSAQVWYRSVNPPSLGASVDRARQPSRLSSQVEPDVEAEQVREDGSGDPTNCALCDAGKDGVAEFGKETGADASESV